MRSLRAQRTQQAAMALEREKAEKYALVQHALADAVSHTLLVPNSNAAAADTDEESQRAAVEVLRHHVDWRIAAASLVFNFANRKHDVANTLCIAVAFSVWGHDRLHG